MHKSHLIDGAFPAELREQSADYAENAPNAAMAEVVFVSAVSSSAADDIRPCDWFMAVVAAAAQCHKRNDAVDIVVARQAENGWVLSHLQHSGDGEMLRCGRIRGFAAGKPVHNPIGIITDVSGEWVTFWKNIL